MTCDIIIPYRDTGDGWRNRIQDWHVERLTNMFAEDDDTSVLIVDSQDEPFSRGGSRNLGVDLSDADYVALVDSDTYFNKLYFDWGLIALMAMDKSWVVPFDNYKRITQETTEELLNSDPSTDKFAFLDEEVIHNFVHPPVPPYQEVVAGCLLFRRQDFLDIGGYDERFTGWGWEDRALADKANAMLGHYVRTEGTVIHMWHPEPPGPEHERPHYAENKALYESILRGL